MSKISHISETHALIQVRTSRENQEFYVSSLELGYKYFSIIINIIVLWQDMTRE